MACYHKVPIPLVCTECTARGAYCTECKEHVAHRTKSNNMKSYNCWCVKFMYVPQTTNRIKCTVVNI
jgi:hypothetical protein